MSIDKYRSLKDRNLRRSVKTCSDMSFINTVLRQNKPYLWRLILRNKYVPQELKEKVKRKLAYRNR